MRLFLVTLVFLASNTMFSQKPSINELEDYSDEAILDLFNDYRSDTIYAESLARIYLTRAKVNRDTIKMARAYDRLSSLFDAKKNIAYTDSIIYFTKNLKNNTYPGLGYLLKGNEYHQIRKYKEALDNYFIAFSYAQENDNELHLLYLEKQIIGILSIWGDAEDAIDRSLKLISKIEHLDYSKILKKNVRASYEVNDSIIEYHKFIDIIEAKSALTTSLLINQDYQVAKRLNEEILGLIENHYEKFHLQQSTIKFGEIAYYTGSYKSSIHTLEKTNLSQSNLNTLLNNHFYIGMSNIRLDSIEKGIKHLKLADSLYDVIGFLVPSQKQLFAELARHYGMKGDIQKQLEYVNKQIYLDSIFNKIYASVNRRVVREYDTPRLIAQKEALIAQLEDEKSLLSKKSTWILVLLLLSLGTIPFFIMRQRKLQKRFDALIKTQESGVKKITKPTVTSSLSSDIIDDIMSKLERFELQQKFLSGSVSLQNVARQFNTNSSYLSKVVNLHKDKNFSQYLNDLRINYAVTELTNNPKFRRYTIKAIAQDVGFGNSQSFSKAFHSKTGLQPSYFIRKLNKQAS